MSFSMVALILHVASSVNFIGATLLAYVTLGGVIGLAAAAYRLLHDVQRSKKSSYAIIEPMSQAEYRQRLATERYPRRHLIVAIVSAVIAVLAIAAAVWIKLTS